MTVIEMVAALFLTVTSGLILAAVWYTDQAPRASKPVSPRQEEEPRYPRAA